MKKPSFLPATATIMGILLAVSFGFSLTPVANADFSNTKWQLTVAGLVEHPLNLTLADIVAMPQTTIYAQLVCVGPPSFVVTEGNWTGVKLWLLLEEAGVSPETVKVAFYAQDAYTTDLQVDTAQRDDIILAYAKDGEPLNEVLRLVVPGKWGYKWISQVTVIELVDYNFLGRWESQGYSDEADVSQGAQSARDLQSLLPVPSPTPTPTTSPSPSPSQPPIASPAPLQQPTPAPKAPKGLFLSIEAVYAIASSVAIVIVVFRVIVVRKRTK